MRVQLDPLPGDDELRPWAYTGEQMARMAEEREAARQEKRDAAFTRFMGG